MTCAKAILAALVAASLAGCVTASGTASSAETSAATMDNECTNLTDTRRKLAVQIDAVESGRAAPGTFTSAILAIGMLNAPVYQMGTMAGAMAQDRTKALAEMRDKQMALTQEIEQRQCTAAAHAEAGTIRPVDGSQQNGTYAGRGQTDS